MKYLIFFSFLLLSSTAYQVSAQSDVPSEKRTAEVLLDSLSFTEPVSAARLKNQLRLKIIDQSGSESVIWQIASFKVQMVGKAIAQTFELQGPSLEPLKPYLSSLVAGDVILITDILAVNGNQTVYLENMTAQLTD